MLLGAFFSKNYQHEMLQLVNDHWCWTGSHEYWIISISSWGKIRRNTSHQADVSQRWCLRAQRICCSAPQTFTTVIGNKERVVYHFDSDLLESERLIQGQIIWKRVIRGLEKRPEEPEGNTSEMHLFGSDPVLRWVLLRTEPNNISKRSENTNYYRKLICLPFEKKHQ